MQLYIFPNIRDQEDYCSLNLYACKKEIKRLLKLFNKTKTWVSIFQDVEAVEKSRTPWITMIFGYVAKLNVFNNLFLCVYVVDSLSFRVIREKLAVPANRIPRTAVCICGRAYALALVACRRLSSAYIQTSVGRAERSSAQRAYAKQSKKCLL